MSNEISSFHDNIFDSEFVKIFERGKSKKVLNALKNIEPAFFPEFVYKNHLKLFYSILYRCRIDNSIQFAKRFIEYYKQIDDIHYISRKDFNEILYEINKIATMFNYEIKAIFQPFKSFGNDVPVYEVPLSREFLLLFQLINLPLLYDYQLKAIKEIILAQKKDLDRGIIVTAPTGGGKSITYIIPSVYNAIFKKLRSILIFPTKALAADQFHSLLELQGEAIKRGLFFQVCTYDGDTPNPRESYRLRKKCLCDKCKNKTKSSQLEAILTKKENELMKITIRGSDCKYKEEYSIEGNLRKAITIKKEILVPRILNILDDYRLQSCPSCSQENSIIHLRESFDKNRKAMIRPFSLCSMCSAIYLAPLIQEDLQKFKPEIVLTNPDKLHYVLQNPLDTWLFEDLRLTVLDEVHTYRGAFGINVHFLINRIKRRLKLNLEKNSFIGTSATISNPQKFFKKLIGCEEVIKVSSSDFILETEIIDLNRKEEEKNNIISEIDLLKHRAGKIHVFLFPPLINRKVSVLNFTTKIIEEIVFLLKAKKLIVFCNSRKNVEELAIKFDKRLIEILASFDLPFSIRSYTASESLSEDEIKKVENRLNFNLRDKTDKVLANIVTDVHQGGLLMTERASIENNFRNNQINVLFATPTLELGIDIGDLDTAILFGFPDEFDKYLQRVGRIGRKSPISIAITIFRENPYERYFFEQSKQAFQVDHKSIPINTNNPVLKEKHNRASICDLSAAQIAKKTVPFPRKLKYFIIPFRTTFSLVSIYLKEKYYYENNEDRSRKMDINRLLSDINLDTPYYLRKKKYRIAKIDGRRVQFNDYVFRIPDKILLKRDHSSQPYLYPRPRLFATNEHNYHAKRVLSQFDLSITKINQPKRSNYVKEAIGFSFRTKGLNIDTGTTNQEINQSFLNLLINSVSVVIGLETNSFNYILYNRNKTQLLFEVASGGIGGIDAIEDCKSEIFNTALKIVKQCNCEKGCPRCIYLPRKYYLIEEKSPYPLKKETEKILIDLKNNNF